MALPSLNLGQLLGPLGSVTNLAGPAGTGSTSNPLSVVTGAVGGVLNPAGGSASGPVDVAQLVGVLGSASGITSAIDLGLSTGAATIVLGETGALLTLPTGGSILPSLSTSTADPSSPAPASNGARFEGDSGNNTIVGGTTHDYATGGGGSDTIQGGDGNDHLYGFGATAGPDGGDAIFGGNGGDYLQGNAGHDTLDGGAGSDRIFGGADNDLIFGQSGNDSVNGNFGNDTIDGGEGNDFLRGGKGDDVIHGGAGNDILSGDLGADLAIGGGGADIFRYASNDAALIATDLLLGKVEAVGDFTNGEDRIGLGFAPTGISYGAAGDVLSATLGYAQTLLGGLGGHGVAAIQVGSDTYLFYGASNGLLADSVIKLDGVGNTQIDVGDFV